MAIRTISEVSVYEIDGKDVTRFPQPRMIVESHWGDEARVKLRLEGDEEDVFIHHKVVTVLARDLMAAIVNATNTNK